MGTLLTPVSGTRKDEERTSFEMPNNAFEADPPSRRAPSPDGALILRVKTLDLENEIKESFGRRRSSNATAPTSS